VSGERALEKGEEGFLDELTTDHRYVDFVEAWWPPVDAVELWRTLPKRVGELANGAFSREELDAMVTSWASGVPAIEDVPLVDELRYLLGEVPPDDERDDDVPRQLMSFERREREVENELRSTTSIDDDGYAHVLVDEAQDLSPMQWRMLGRRGRYASWTIVGDLAQSSWPHADEAEQARVAALEGKVEHRFRLSTNYRNSAEIYDLAADVAQVAIPGADLAEAVRRTGEAPRHEWVADAALLDAVEAEADTMLERVEGTCGCSTVSTPRAWSSTRWSWSSPTRSSRSPRPAGGRSTSSSPAPPSSSPPSAPPRPGSRASPDRTPPRPSAPPRVSWSR
jgi:hypothetical protein